MNTDTGRIYRGQEEIEAAKSRGEPVVPVSEHVAKTMEAGASSLSRKFQRELESRNKRIAANLKKRRKSPGEIAIEKLAQIHGMMESIVVTDGCDRGVILLSSDGPTHYDEQLKGQVYDYEHFSPLGNALIDVYEVSKPD